jgi:hypothetical protein
VRFLKELQPGSRRGCQQIVLLGKGTVSKNKIQIQISYKKFIDGSNLLKTIGSHKISNWLHEVELKNSQQESITYVIWDLTGRGRANFIDLIINIL